MARLFSAEWLAGSSREVVGGPVDHCRLGPLQQRGSPHEERQDCSRARMGSPEAPGVSAAEQSSRSSFELTIHEHHEQEVWEARSHCSDASSAPSVRGRTKFSPRQLQELERSFQGQHYLGASEKRRLSKVLKLSPLQIKTWFQNRRMKFKRQAQEARVRAVFSGLYHRYPGTCAPSGLPGLEYNTACPPSSIMPLHPTLPYPAWLTHSYSSLPAFIPNTPFQFSAAAPYQPTNQGPFLTPAYERLRFHSHLLSS